MVYVNLWDPRPGFGPHGIVHIACADAQNPREPAKWREAESWQAADRMFPDHTLYWCSRRACFGVDNPRAFPRN